MHLLHPSNPTHPDFDNETNELLKKTVAFFENKGKAEMKDEDHRAVWVEDFMEFIKETGVFAKFLTPSEYGAEGCRFDMARNTRFSELLGFYSLSHWYPWQVSILGLGPFWISSNEEAKKRAAAELADGGVFGFALSEKEHGADLIGTDMMLHPQDDGTYKANGDKYYIGNGNCAALLSCFSKVEGSRDYAFFAVEPKHETYELLQNVVYSQKYVAEFMLHDYPVQESDILMRGRAAWDASLATVAYAKFNLGLASTGIATHAFYEAINHAGNRKLYNNYVTDFPHIRELFTEAYARLVAMRLFCYRAKDYMRVASPEDRRYLLWNPMVKMKVTMQGEEVINLIWDAIAARGFCKDMYFEGATRDIRMLPKLEGTAHVNMVLVIKFMQSFLFNDEPVADVPHDMKPGEESFMFKQGATTKKLDAVNFGPWRARFAARTEPNAKIFLEQADALCAFLEQNGPDAEQAKDLDWMLTVGEMFTLISYASLVLEQAEHEKIETELIDEFFHFQVRDFSRHALNLYQKAGTTSAQQQAAMGIVKRPHADESRRQTVYDMVMKLKDAYEMKP